MKLLIFFLVSLPMPSHVYAQQLITSSNRIDRFCVCVQLLRCFSLSQFSASLVMNLAFDSMVRWFECVFSFIRADWH